MENKIKELQPSKIKMSKKKVYLILTVSALLSSFATYYFILAAELYTPGLGGLSNGIVYASLDLYRGLHNDMSPQDFANFAAAFKPTVYWIIYGLANIPIIYLTLKWYSKRFFTLSVYYFAVNLVITMIMTYVPGFQHSLLDGLDGNILYISTLFLSIVGGIIYGIAVGLAFKVGACTMGLDPVIRHFSREKGKNIAPLLFVVTITNSIFWIFIRYIIQASFSTSVDPFAEVPIIATFTWKSFVANTILSKSFIGSWLFVGTYSMVTGVIYSSNSKAEIFITTKKSKEISEYWIKTNYHRGHSIIEIEGGYSHEKRRAIKMIINMEEMHDVVEQVAALDNKAFITVSELKKVYDIHDWRPMTKDDMDKQKEVLINEHKRVKKLDKKKENNKLRKKEKLQDKNNEKEDKS